MDQETVEGHIHKQLEAMQTAAVKDKWFKVHPKWNELNRKRELLGMQRVQPVDEPTKEHFE